MFIKEVAVKTEIGTTVVYDEFIEAHAFKDGVRIMRDYCYPANGKYRSRKRDEKIIKCKDYDEASQLVGRIYTYLRLNILKKDYKRTVI